MKKQVVFPSHLAWREFDNRAELILQKIQKTLLPEYASNIVAINVETGEYVSAATKDKAYEAFHKRWPHQLAFVVRADGGPVTKFHGK